MQTEKSNLNGITETSLNYSMGITTEDTTIQIYFGPEGTVKLIHY